MLYHIPDIYREHLRRESEQGRWLGVGRSLCSLHDLSLQLTPFTNPSVD